MPDFCSRTPRCGGCTTSAWRRRGRVMCWPGSSAGCWRAERSRCRRRCGVSICTRELVRRWGARGDRVPGARDPGRSAVLDEGTDSLTVNQRVRWFESNSGSRISRGKPPFPGGFSLSGPVVLPTVRLPTCKKILGGTRCDWVAQTDSVRKLQRTRYYVTLLNETPLSKTRRAFARSQRDAREGRRAPAEAVRPHARRTHAGASFATA